MDTALTAVSRVAKVLLGDAPGFAQWMEAGRVGTLLVALLAGAPAGTAAPEVEAVARDALVEAMRGERGYDCTATTNLARFQAGVLLRLACGARERRPDGPPLLIEAEDWFRAYLEALGLPEARAPLPVRLSYEQGNAVTIEHRPQRVVLRVRKGPAPSLALYVRWSSSRESARPGYSYEDALARPRLKITVGRTVTYRLLELDGLVVYDEIQGIWGRPTTGPLALLFRLIGEARPVFSRIAVSEDEWPEPPEPLRSPYPHPYDGEIAAAGCPTSIAGCGSGGRTRCSW